MNIDLLIQELERDEGKKNFPYRDSEGLLTIGVGRNIQQCGISDDEIAYLLKNNIAEMENDLDRAIPWWRQLSEERQRVLANMCFNMGIERLLGFHNMLAAAKVGDYQLAAAEMMDSQWAKQVGDRSKRLEKMMEA